MTRAGLLLFIGLTLHSVGPTAAPARPVVTLKPLDGGGSTVGGVHVLAMAMSPDGTLYAGGRHVQTIQTAGQSTTTEIGSAFLISHDHGAHWTERISDEPPPGYVAHFPGWTDHTRWPNNFTVYQLVIDPTHPTTLYAAGGFPVSGGSRGQPHLLLRSTDGGQTWTDLLIHRVDRTATPSLVTNIAVTSANRQDLTYRHIYNAQALVIDPRDVGHLYLATDGLGVLQTTNSGATWHYNPSSPSVAGHTAEQMVIDLRHPATLYILIQDTTVAFLYRSDDGDITWHQVWHGGFASTMNLEVQTLYLTRADGVYASTDRGLHWRLAVSPRSIPGFTSRTNTTSTGTAGAVVEALYDQQIGAWVIVTDISVAANPFGIFSTNDGGTTWHLLTHGLRTPKDTLALDIHEMSEGYTRLWLDAHPRPNILFTSNSQDGLYRWSIVA